MVPCHDQGKIMDRINRKGHVPRDIALEMYCWTVFQKGANLITFRELKNNLI